MNMPISLTNNMYNKIEIYQNLYLIIKMIFKNYEQLLNVMELWWMRQTHQKILIGVKNMLLNLQIKKITVELVGQCLQLEQSNLYILLKKIKHRLLIFQFTKSFNVQEIMETKDAMVDFMIKHIGILSILVLPQMIHIST